MLLLGLLSRLQVMRSLSLYSRNFHTLIKVPSCRSVIKLRPRALLYLIPHCGAFLTLYIHNNISNFICQVILKLFFYFFWKARWLGSCAPLLILYLEVSSHSQDLVITFHSSFPLVRQGACLQTLLSGPIPCLPKPSFFCYLSGRCGQSLSTLPHEPPLCIPLSVIGDHHCLVAVLRKPIN